MFGDSIATTSIKLYNAQKAAQKEANEPTVLVKQQLIYLQTALDDKNTSITALETALGDTTLLEPQIVALKTQYTTLLDEYSILKKQYTAILTAYEDGAEAAVSVLQAQNSMLPYAQQYEANERTVNDIYFSTIAVGDYNLSTSVQGLLQSIAYQCPYSGGEAVYSARSILALVERPYYNDRALCAAQGVLWRTQNPKNTDKKDAKSDLKVKVFPNPTASVSNILLQGEHFDLSLTLTDMLGRVIMDNTIAEKATTTQLSFDGMVTGIYVLTLRDTSGNIVTQQKINYIR